MKQKRLFFLILLLFILFAIRFINPYGLTDDELTRLIVEAVEDGNARKVRSLIAQGADINASDTKGKTLLHVAIEYGQYDVAKLLISKGLDVNQKDRYGVTPLGLAVGGYRDRRELPEAKDADGYCQRGGYFYWRDEFDRAIEDLTSAIRINPEDDHAYYWRGRAWAEKDNPVQAVDDWKRAIRINWRNALHTYYIRRLLKSPDQALNRLIEDIAMEHIEDLEVVSGYAVGYSASPGEFYTVSLIISSPFEEERFLKIAQSNNPVVRAMAIICLARENVSKYQKTIHSFNSDTTEVVYVPMGCGIDRITLDKLAKNVIEDPNMLDYWSASHTDWILSPTERDSETEKVVQLQISVVQALIAKDADVNPKDQYGETPLHYAAERGIKHVAEVLIANGAVINVENNKGETPLHSATFWGNRELIELLITNGADINAKTNDGYTATEIATQMDYPGLSNLLREFRQNR